jgi:acyl-CoA synthetase (AMP-forming)/AMP-acid ligase II
VNVSDLALILYTSGTTGKPKGVMLSHNNLFANMWSIFGSLPILRTDRCLVVLPFYHSFGNSLLTTHLSSGASLVLQNNIAFPHHVLKRIESDRITSLYGVPLTFSLLLGKPVPSDIDISSLRYMAQAGGAMYKRQVRQLKRDVPHIDLFVMYGQTEATARLACVPVEMLEKKLGSAGRPVRGVEIEIRDGQGNYVPTGGAGEIWVRGDSVMLGYWGDPEGSANVLQRGWLWTRDRGRLDEDGFLYLEGRSDEIIKTGANRVNPEEVEEVISMLEGVKEVGVVGIPDAVLGQAVFAAVVPNAGAHFSEKSVRAHCLHLLAPYKVPKRVMLIDRLPRTSSGKIRRRELAHVVGGADDGGNKW